MSRRRQRARARPLAICLPLALLAVALCSQPPQADKPAEETIEQYIEVSAGVLETEPPPEPERLPYYSGVELTEEDVYTLACLVYHEARGEPFEGQVAVVEVVFNRMISDRFPDTVEEVVFQKYGDVWQFSPAPYLWTAEPGETQYSAVMYAYNAEEPVVPPETVFFSTSPYNEHITAVIGNHYFCEI